MHASAYMMGIGCRKRVISDPSPEVSVMIEFHPLAVGA